jgi:hypothetical protein
MAVGRERVTLEARCQICGQPEGDLVHGGPARRVRFCAACALGALPGLLGLALWQQGQGRTDRHDWARGVIDGLADRIWETMTWEEYLNSGGTWPVPR